MAYFSLVAHRL